MLAYGDDTTQIREMSGIHTLNFDISPGLDASTVGSYAIPGGCQPAALQTDG